MNNEELKKQVDYYISLKYPLKVSEMESGGYFIEVIDLPGCMCDAETFKNIPAEVEKAMRAWIEGTLERGGSVPLPKKDELYSGHFIVRIPKSLHRNLALLAEQEGTSLNQLCVSLLSERQTYKEISREILKTCWEIKQVSQAIYNAVNVPTVGQPENFPIPREAGTMPESASWKAVA